MSFLTFIWVTAGADPNISFNHNLSVSYNISDMENVTTKTRVSCSSTHWHLYLKLVFVPAIVLFGITGNFLSFLVMSRPSYACKPYSCYLRALAVCDTLTLVFTMLVCIY